MKNIYNIKLIKGGKKLLNARTTISISDAISEEQILTAIKNVPVLYSFHGSLHMNS